MARLSIVVTLVALCAICCLTVSGHKINSRLVPQEKPVLSAIESEGFFSCIEHPIDCIESEGDKIIQYADSAYQSLKNDAASAWKSFTGDLTALYNKINTSYNNFVKWVNTTIRNNIVGALSGLVRTVLKKVGSTIVNAINSFKTDAQTQMQKLEQPIMDKISSTWTSAKSKIKGLFSSSSKATDVSSEATGSDAQAEIQKVTTAKNIATATDAATELELVVEDTVSSNNMGKIIGKSVELGAVFAVIDVGLLMTGYPIIVYQDRALIKSSKSSFDTKFQADFIDHYQYAIFDTFKNVCLDFLSYAVSAISASISATVMAAIDVATLGLGALAAAAIAFILDFVISFIINLILSAIISFSFKPFYTYFWTAGGLQADVTQLAKDLLSNAESLAGKF